MKKLDEATFADQIWVGEFGTTRGRVRITVQDDGKFVAVKVAQVGKGNIVDIMIGEEDLD